MGARINVAKDRRRFNVDQAGGFGPSFTVKTSRISCKSGPYLGPDHKYERIIVYGRSGETDWYTANGTLCTSGYALIMKTDVKAFKDLQAAWSYEPSQVHGITASKV